jgi:hypothetical protein
MGPKGSVTTGASAKFFQSCYAKRARPQLFAFDSPVTPGRSAKGTSVLAAHDQATA